MGYLKHKYTKGYFLKEDSAGNPTVCGAEGVQDFKKGGIRAIDRDTLRRLHFRGKNVLDLGFGRGEAIKFAIDNGASKVIGVDFSDDANEIARQFLDSYGIHAELYCDDALIFLQSYVTRGRAEPFDIVMMLDFVEHVPRSELGEILRLIRSVLSARAVVAINTPRFQVDNDVISHGLDPRTIHSSDEFEGTAGMHCNRYTKKSLQTYMRNYGFIAISGHFFVPNLSVGQPIEGSRYAWLKAWRRRYPILLSALLRSERFERAFLWEEIVSRQNRPTNKMRIIFRFSKAQAMAVLHRIRTRSSSDKAASVPSGSKSRMIH